MTDSIRGMGACPDAGADVDAYLRAATGARTDASATRHAECAERYESDLAFQHGVDAARAQRDADPVAYEAARREAGTPHTSVMDGRSGPVRG